jgi:hypothetical protein
MGTRPARASDRQSSSARPATGMITLALLGLVMIANLIGAIISIALLVEPNEAQLLFGSPVSDWFWGLSALLFTALTLVCAFVLRAAWKRDAGAGLAVSVLSLIGIGYSLLSITHGYGWAILVVSLGTLIMNQIATAAGYYSGDALSTGHVVRAPVT